MNAARLDGKGQRNAAYRFLCALRLGYLFPAVACHSYQEGQAERHHLPGVRSARRSLGYHCRRICGYALLACAISAQAQTFADRVPAAQQTISDLWTTFQQVQALLATAQQQSTADAATILTLRNQVAALQAQLAGVPICPPVVICPVCPAPVVCPSPIPPPVVTPQPPGPGSAVLTWNAVTGASGYRVYYGTASGVYVQALGQGIQVLAPPFTVGNLATGIRYYFAVTATSATAESGFSNEVFKDIGAIVLPPPPPPPTTSPAGTKMPPATQILDGIATWTPAPQTGGLASQIGLLRNGVRMANSVDFLLWTGTTIYLSDFGSGSGWQKWNGTGFVDTIAP